MDQGRSGGIGISRAKRLLKELQAQAAAGQLAQRLHSLLQDCPVGSASLKVRSLKNVKIFASYLSSQRAESCMLHKRLLTRLLSIFARNCILEGNSYTVHAALLCS